MSDPELRRIVDFEQLYVGGDIGEGPVNSTNWMHCFHRPSECDGHKAMLCAKNISVLDEWFDMVICMDRPRGIKGITYGHSYSIPENAEACASKAALNWAEVKRCVSSDLGSQLLHDSHFSTMKMFKEHGGYTPPGHGYRPPLIPSIWIYNASDYLSRISPVEYNNPLIQERNPYAELRERVCEAYDIDGTKPAACNTN